MEAVQIAKTYLQQNHSNITYAIQQLQNEINQAKQEYITSVQHQVDASVLILDLSDQATKIVPELNQLLDQLKKQTQPTLENIDQVLFESVGYAKNNVQKSIFLLQNLNQVPYKIAQLQKQIQDNLDLVLIQKELLIIEKIIVTINNDTQTFLEQRHVNKKLLSQQLSHETEEGLNVTKKYYQKFNEFHTTLYNYIVNDAPCSLLTQMSYGQVNIVQKYITILLEQEKLNYNCLKKYFTEIAMNITKNMEANFTFVEERPDFDSLLKQVGIHFQNIMQMQQFFEKQAQDSLINSYKMHKFNNLQINDFLPLPRLLTGAVHLYVLQKFENSIQKTLQSEYFSPKFIQDILVFCEKYNKLVKVCGLSYRRLKYQVLTNHQQLMSEAQILGVKPHQYVQMQIEQGFDYKTLGQVLGPVLEQIFKKQLEVFWNQKASQDDKMILLQQCQLIQINQQNNQDDQNNGQPNYQLNQQLSNYEKMSIDELFYEDYCQLRNINIFNQVISQYDKYCKQMFNQIVKKLNDNYTDLMINTKYYYTTLPNDFFFFADQQSSVLLECTDQEVKKQLAKVLLNYVSDVVRNLSGTLFKELHEYGIKLNFQQIIQVVNDNNSVINFFDGIKQPELKQLEKCFKLFHSPQVNYQVLSQQLDSTKIQTDLMILKKDQYSQIKELQTNYNHDYEQLRKENDKQNIYMIIANDQAIILDNYQQFFQNIEQFCDGSEEIEAKYTQTVQQINDTLKLAFNKHSYLELSKFSENFSTLFTEKHVPTFWKQISQYILDCFKRNIENIQTKTKKLKIAQNYFKEVFSQQLLIIEFTSFMFRGQDLKSAKQLTVEEQMAENSLGFQIQLDKDLKYISLIIKTIDVAKVEKTIQKLQIFAEQSLKPSNIDMLSPLLIICYNIKYKGTAKHLFIKEQREQFSLEWQYQKIIRNQPILNQFWQIRDNEILELGLKELE